ncbi:MAG: PPC domain-containing protein [Planctomycetaceae bacterium]|nr:PPC domain-containing protein [Planctomycetaceae bacterium]
MFDEFSWGFGVMPVWKSRVSCVGFLFVHLWSGSIAAAPPDVTALFPAGGMRGSEVRIKLQGKIEADASELWTATPGIEWIGADGKDAVKLKIAAEAPLGVVWLTWHNAEGVSPQRAFVVGSLPEINESDSNNSIVPGAAALTLPVVANGVLEKAGDVDTYPVVLKTGETLVATLDALKTFGSPMDGLVQVADAHGFVLIQNDDARGFDPRLSFTAPRDDTYYVRVFAFPAAPDSSIRFSGAPTYVYRLTLTTGPVVTRWSPPVLASGGTATLRGYGWNTPGDGIPCEPLSLTPGFASLLRPDFVGLAPIQVQSHTVVAATPDNSKSQPQVVVLPVCVAGQLSSRRAEQAWKFVGTKGQRLHLQAATEDLGSPLDALVRVFDAAGKRLHEFDDTKKADFEIDAEFTLPADGEYTVVISERFWHGGPDYVYSLTLAPSAPDFELTVAQNAFVIKSGDKLEIPVAIDRQRGLAAPISISISDLPDGITVEPVVSEPKGDSSKSVKLIVKSTREASWLGPLRIVGKTTADPMIERTAAAAPVPRQIVPPQVLLKALAKTP